MDVSWECLHTLHGLSKRGSRIEKRRSCSRWKYYTKDFYKILRFSRFKTIKISLNNVVENIISFRYMKQLYMMHGKMKLEKYISMAEHVVSIREDGRKFSLNV